MPPAEKRQTVPSSPSGPEPGILREIPWQGTFFFPLFLGSCKPEPLGAIPGGAAKKSPRQTPMIVENNGLFFIPRDAGLPAFEQDPGFKALVDSVLN